MFNWIVRFSLQNRLFVLVVAAILMGYGAIGAGAGFYVGSDRVGLNLDLSLIALVGNQFGLLVDVYAGPQIQF